jgi:hypothetical protein
VSKFNPSQNIKFAFRGTCVWRLYFYFSTTSKTEARIKIAKEEILIRSLHNVVISVGFVDICLLLLMPLTLTVDTEFACLLTQIPHLSYDICDEDEWSGGLNCNEFAHSPKQ